ncbi:hypothetical protein V8E36_007303 [Tilletia maclaganii]
MMPSQTADPHNPSLNERTPLLSNARDRQPNNDTIPNARSETVSDASKTPARQIGPDALRGLLMLLMAFDHANVNFSTFPHGTSVHSENASTVVERFSTGVGYWLRTFSHLCASGFALLLGFGLVYFVSSRAQRGWTPLDQIGYISKRALAIVLVNEATFLPFVYSSHIWLINIILPALALDYFLVGLLVVGLDYAVQPALDRLLATRGAKARADSGARRSRMVDEATPIAAGTKSAGGSLSSWLIDAFLATLFFVTAFSTIWSAPHQGRCVATTSETRLTTSRSSQLHELAAPCLDAKCKPSPSIIYQILYIGEMCPNLGVVSVFPPLAWISFVLLGVVYARVLLRARIHQRGLVAFNIGLGLAFALLFVSTRLLQYGNLSTDCLQTAAQQHQRHGANQYLADLKSFLYVTKYNPDPAFVFLTSSTNFFLLAFFGALFALPTQTSSALTKTILNTLQKILLTYGIQALFFYSFHQLLLAALAASLRALAPGLFEPRDPAIYPRPDGLGWSGYFVGWAGAVFVCYAACRWFGAFKARRGPDSIWRFI